MRTLLPLLVALLVAAPATAQEAPPAEEAPPTEEEAPPAEEEEVAPAEEEAPPAEDPAALGLGFGTIDLLRDRTGGALTVVRHHSREVEVVRNGTPIPATPGMDIQLGDAVRCGLGIAAIVTPDGARIEIGERSQVRIDAGLLTQRLGDVLIDTPRPLAVLVGTTRIEVADGAVRVTSGLNLQGIAQVLRGTVRVIDGDQERVLEGGQATDLGTEATGVRTLSELEVAALAEPRASFVRPEAQPLASADRVHILIAGGISHLDASDWGQGELSTRVRVHGPVWISVGAGLIARPAEEVLGYDTVLALPARLGVRFIAPLPRSVFLHGGADFTLLVGERCTSLDGCPRKLSAEPGGVVELGAGVHIDKHLGLQIEIAGGLYRRRLPPPAPGLGDVVFTEFQFHGLVGLFVRL